MSELSLDHTVDKPNMDLDTNSIISGSNFACQQKKSGGVHTTGLNSTSKSQFGPLCIATNFQTKSSSTHNVQKVDLVTVSDLNSLTDICVLHGSTPGTDSEQLTSKLTGGPSTMSCQLVINHGRGSGTSTRSDSLESSTVHIKPHTAGDVRWDAINSVSLKDSPLGLSNFRLLKRLCYGEIGSVYLVELRGTHLFCNKSDGQRISCKSQQATSSSN